MTRYYVRRNHLTDAWEVVRDDGYPFVNIAFATRRAARRFRRRWMKS